MELRSFLLPEPSGERFSTTAAASMVGKTVPINGTPYLIVAAEYVGAKGIIVTVDPGPQVASEPLNWISIHT